MRRVGAALAIQAPPTTPDNVNQLIQCPTDERAQQSVLATEQYFEYENQLLVAILFIYMQKYISSRVGMYFINALSSASIEKIDFIWIIHVDTFVFSDSYFSKSGVLNLIKAMNHNGSEHAVFIIEGGYVNSEILKDLLSCQSKNILIICCLHLKNILFPYMENKNTLYCNSKASLFEVNLRLDFFLSKKHICRNEFGEQQSSVLLTKREIEVILMYINGLSIKLIAERLHLAPKTVYNFKTNAMIKIGTKKKSELIKLYNMMQLYPFFFTTIFPEIIA